MKASSHGAMTPPARAAHGPSLGLAAAKNETYSALYSVSFGCVHTYNSKSKAVSCCRDGRGARSLRLRLAVLLGGGLGEREAHPQRLIQHLRPVHPVDGSLRFFFRLVLDQRVSLHESCLSGLFHSFVRVFAARLKRRLDCGVDVGAYRTVRRWGVV